MLSNQLSEDFSDNKARLTKFSCSALIVIDVSHFNSCILKNTNKKYFLPPARRLVRAVPAVQELQPVLLPGVHPRARHRDQEPAEEVQVDGHPGNDSHPAEPDDVAGLAATTWGDDDHQSNQHWQQREDNLAKRRRWYCSVIATVLSKSVISENKHGGWQKYSVQHKNRSASFELMILGILK